MPFDLIDYLARIDHDPLPVSPEGLTALQIAQLRAIPFENTELLLGRAPDLAPSAIWRKLVVEKRGGYCLELNTLLGQALEALGYQAAPILGRVRMGAASGGPRAHLAHIVTLDGTEWLVDAGFGGPGPEAPLMLGRDAPAEQSCGTYRLRPDAASGEQVLERQTPDGWFALYGFDRVPVTPPDVVAANVVCATWDKSPFPNHLMMHRLLSGRRASLFNRALKLPEGTRELQSRADLSAALTEVFGLPADLSRDEAIWRKIDQEMALAS